MKAKITTAIPVRNGQEFILQTLQSLAAQTLRPDRVVVLDNLSTDATPEIVKNFKNLPIEFISNPKDLGTFGNFDRCLDFAAETEYLQIFHADDLILPQFYEVMAGQLQDCPGRAFGWCIDERIDEHNRHLTFSDKADGSVNVLDRDTFLKIKAEIGNQSFCSTLMKTNYQPAPARFPMDMLVYGDMVYWSARIVPQKDDSPLEGRLEQSFAAALPRAKSATRGMPGAMAAPAPASAFGGAAHDGGAAYDFLAKEEMGRPAVKAEAEEAATQVLYRFPSKVTLASGATMMVPFVDHEIGASRTYLYQPETNAFRPLAAVKLKNDGDSALPAGLVTAYETSADGTVNFAGDAQLPLLPKGATRFVTFALDAKTAIRRTDKGIKQARLGKAVRGELTTTVKSLWTVDYEITPPAEEDREVIVEEPRQDSWTPAGDSKGAEETPTRLRFTVQAPKGKTTKATLYREHMDYESVTLSSMAPDRIVAVISGLENQTPALKETIAKLGVLAGDIGKANAHKRELEAERKKIAEDQDRIRKNLASAGAGRILAAAILKRSRRRKTVLARLPPRKKPSSRMSPPR